MLLSSDRQLGGLPLRLDMFALVCSARYSYILNDDIRIAFLGFGRALAFSFVIYGSLGGWAGGIEDGLYKDSIYGPVAGPSYSVRNRC